LTYRLGGVPSIDDRWQQEGVVRTSHDEPSVWILSGELFDKI
jgi:hypothetical protein